MAELDVDDHILAVAFDPQFVSIQFVDPEQTSRRVSEIKELRIDPTLVAEELVELMDLLKKIIYEAQVEMRAPEKSFTRSSR